MARCLGISACLVVGAVGCTAIPDEADWRTHAERTEFAETGRFEEVVQFCRRLERQSPWVRVESIGTTGEGRDLLLVIVSRERAFTPAAAAASGKAIVLITNGIHAGEIEGKDASLALLREIAVTRRRTDLLDHVVLLVLPIFNVDGHERVSAFNRINQNGPREMGWRCTASGLNLNRDFVKADAVEMKAWLRMYHAWRPHLFFDTHTTDGADWQFDVTFASTDGPDAAPPVARWVRDRLYPRLFETLMRDGHVPGLYFWMRDRLDPSRGLENGGFSPRFSTGYGSITNRPSILIETHMLKPYGMRVRGTYNLIVRTLELINADPRALIDAVRQADEETARGTAAETPRRVVLTTSRPAGAWGEPITFRGFEHRMARSEASGVEHPQWDPARPMAVETRLFRDTQPDKIAIAPKAYLVPPQWTDVIERLQLHGLAVERLERPWTGPVESDRFLNVRWEERPFEGRHRVDFESRRFRETRTYPAGSALVRLNQPMAKVAVHLLEPEAPDSLVRWGFFDTIFEQKEYFEDYAMAPLADRMLKEDAALRAEFEARLAADPEFASSPRARLQFFYERSPYWDTRKDVYPVGWVPADVAVR